MTKVVDHAGQPTPARDQRRHQRMRVSLLGRYMLANHREYPCQTVDMSPGGVGLTCAVVGDVGERIVLYLEHIGRVEGSVARHIPGGLAVRLGATLRKREKIASQLTWLANRDDLGLPDGRTHERLTPTQPSVTIRLDSGREFAARVIDISISGVAIAMTNALPIGTAIMVGTTPCRVVRAFDGGIGAQFLLPISPDRFYEGMQL